MLITIQPELQIYRHCQWICLLLRLLSVLPFFILLFLRLLPSATILLTSLFWLIFFLFIILLFFVLVLTLMIIWESRWHHYAFGHVLFPEILEILACVFGEFVIKCTYKLVIKVPRINTQCLFIIVEQGTDLSLLHFFFILFTTCHKIAWYEILEHWTSFI